MYDNAKTALQEAARVIGAVVVIAGLLWAVGKPHAENLVNQTVDNKLKDLEQQINRLDSSAQAMITQQALQQQRSQFMDEQTRQMNQDINEIQRDIKLIIRTLRDSQ